MTTREKYSTTLQSIENILANTPNLHKLIYVDYQTPLDIRQLIPERVTIIDSSAWEPQLNRYSALPHITSEFTVFLDNDVLVEPYWLDRLLNCMNETGAGVVGPLYLWNGGRTIHMAGGKIKRGRNNHNFMEAHLHVDKPRHFALRRSKVDYMEYHCVLVRTNLLAEILDPAYKSIHEHIDLSLEAKRLGYDTYIEPTSVIQYLNNVSLTENDKVFFAQRWKLCDVEDDIRHFCSKWGYDNNECFDNVRNFVKTH